MTCVMAEPCMDVMDQACVRVRPLVCLHCDAGMDRTLSIDPQACIDCGACEPACPVEAIAHAYDLPTRWRPSIDIDALWFHDPEAARARVAALHEGDERAQAHTP